MFVLDPHFFIFSLRMQAIIWNNMQQILNCNAKNSLLITVINSTGEVLAEEGVEYDSVDYLYYHINNINDIKINYYLFFKCVTQTHSLGAIMLIKYLIIINSYQEQSNKTELSSFKDHPMKILAVQHIFSMSFI